MSRNMQSPFSQNFIKRLSPDSSILFEKSSEVSPVKASSFLTSFWESRMYAKFLQHDPHQLHACVGDSLIVFMVQFLLSLCGLFFEFFPHFFFFFLLSFHFPLPLLKRLTWFFHMSFSIIFRKGELKTKKASFYPKDAFYRPYRCASQITITLIFMCGKSKPIIWKKLKIFHLRF